jgi:hypothetical protein
MIVKDQLLRAMGYGTKGSLKGFGPDVVRVRKRYSRLYFVSAVWFIFNRCPVPIKSYVKIYSLELPSSVLLVDTGNFRKKNFDLSRLFTLPKKSHVRFVCYCVHYAIFLIIMLLQYLVFNLVSSF